MFRTPWRLGNSVLPRPRGDEVPLSIMPDYAQARTNMVESQLRPNKVSDPAVLEAFLAVPREIFVPAALKGAAYADEDLPLGNGRYLIEPLVLARLVQEAAIQPGDKVLVVGCGSGYCAAVVATLAGSVVATESDPALAALARAALGSTSNVSVVECALDDGCGAHGPFDVVLLCGAVPRVPHQFFDQLAEGGRLVGVVSSHVGGLGEALLVERIGGAQSRRILFDAGIRSLPGFAAEPEFVF